MELASPKDSSSVASSPLSSPNVGALLKIKILSWSQETGLPVSVRVRVGNRTFNVHKFPLFSKSGYFKRRLDESTEIELPPEFPGGPETFEMIVLFVYGSSMLIDPFNVAVLRCAAEFLEMTEEHSAGNLCERFDLYMNQVVLQNWDDTLTVLQKCQALLPLAEELLIVSRCIESLAFMACMEILDPERRRDHPVVTLEALKNNSNHHQGWSSQSVKEIVSQDLWIKDLIALPFNFFKRIIGSLRRQGMKEKYVSPIIIFYATKWVLSKKTRQFCENTAGTDNKVSAILHGVLDLLPLGEKPSKLIPIGFYFALLSKSLEVRLRTDARAKLQDQIVSMLHHAKLHDLISSSIELSALESIVSIYVAAVSAMDISHTPSAQGNNSAVAELWDAYLSHIALDQKIGTKIFMKLIETVPISYRQSHDNLYRALNTFLQVRPELSQEEKGAVCKYLSCQKLSQEVCVQAVQNELMPLRLIVQALFVQQLNTQQAFKECSDSFRYTHCGEFSGSLSSSRCPYSKSHNLLGLGESPYSEDPDGGRKPLSFLLQKDHVIPRSDIHDNEFESTSFRIQTLEQELMSLKRSLQWQNISNTAEENLTKQNNRSLGGWSLGKRRDNLEQTTGCIGSVAFTSQRQYAKRIMKIFRRITLTGITRSRRKPGSPNSCPR